MHCPACDKDVHPYQDVAENGRILNVCPGCSAPLGQAKPNAAPPAPRLRVVEAPTTPEPMPAPAASTAPVARPHAPVATPAAVHPTDVVGGVRARLAVVEAELERLRALQREARLLRAMVRAAERAQRADAASPEPTAQAAAE